MSHAGPLLVTARLASGLGGHEPPKLDGLLERMLAHHHRDAVPSYLVDRALPPPPMAAIPIPILRGPLGPWVVGACSDPIVGHVHDDRHEHLARRLGTERAGLLEPGSRVVVATTNTWTKSHRLPIRVRRVEVVRWFAVGERGRVLDALGRCLALGKKVSVGYGRVAEWTVEGVEHDYSWFAPLEGDPARLVLMRTLPAGPWLPMANLVGWKRDFCGIAPPYWHPSRAADAVRPV